MYYCLVYFPKTEIYSINKIRQKYDPTYNIISPHLTIMYPVPSSVGEKKIIKHIDVILEKRRPINICFSGYKKSWDHWLLLIIEEGNSEIKKLIKEIYSGILSKYLRKDIKLIPHIGLGLFIKDYKQYSLKDPKRLILDKKKYQRALLKAKSKIQKFKCTVDSLELVKINNNFTRIKTIKKFILNRRTVNKNRGVGELLFFLFLLLT